MNYGTLKKLPVHFLSVLVYESNERGNCILELYRP